jgi:hypothetical protein
MLVRYYATPMLTDFTPWYDQLNDYFLSYFTPAAHFFGMHWFSPRSAFDDLLQKALEIYEAQGLTPDSSVVFVGVNSGGLFAKVLGMLTGHRGISFVSLPAACDEFQFRYEFDERNVKWASNVFNLDGWFGVSDEGVGENFILTGSSEVISMDAIYPSFCNLAEMCGFGEQFGPYCEAAIGADDLDEIRNYFDE